MAMSPPVGKRVAGRRKSVDKDFNADRTELPIENPAGPSRGKQFRRNYDALCLGLHRPFAHRCSFLLRARIIFANNDNCRFGNAELSEDIAVQFGVGGYQPETFGLAGLYIREQNFSGIALLVESRSGKRAHIDIAAQHHDGIGMGQFVHLLRRNLPMIYIIEDNGVYGLTKGQFSATADLGSKLKTGVINDLPAIDTCALAIQLGATFVGRSFSGDKKQLLAMLKAAIAHKGTVMLDVISPCVTFNDHEGSTKSYKFMQDHDEPVNEIGFVASFEEIDVDYDSGQVYEVEMHDGSSLRLRKLQEDYDPTNKANAVRTLMEAEENNEVLTGVFYINTEKPTFTDLLNLVDEPLATLPESLTRPPKSALDSLMASLQ